MIISFLLNGKEVTINTEPERRSLDLLRDEFGLLAAKGRCYKGICGKCTILLNGETALSCLLPAFALKGNTVTTLEGIAKTREYADIIRSFEETGYRPCHACESGKIITIYSLLEQKPAPTKEEIVEALKGIPCTCGDYKTLIESITLASGYIRRRKRARKR